MEQSITFTQLAKDLAEEIDRIERNAAEEKRRAVERACVLFVCGLCGRATANGSEEFAEQVYRLMPELKREGE